MTQEDKQLLLKDLCARLPYGVNATTTSMWNGIYAVTGYANDRIYLDCPVYDKGDDEWLVESVRPYLRPLSSMTEEEYEELKEISDYYGFAPFEYIDDWCPNYDMTDWLNAHYFDYRGLIEKGLALEAPKGMYN